MERTRGKENTFHLCYSLLILKWITGRTGPTSGRPSGPARPYPLTQTCSNGFVFCLVFLLVCFRKEFNKVILHSRYGYVVLCPLEGAISSVVYYGRLFLYIHVSAGFCCQDCRNLDLQNEQSSFLNAGSQRTRSVAIANEIWGYNPENLTLNRTGLWLDWHTREGRHLEVTELNFFTNFFNPRWLNNFIWVRIY